MEQTLAQKWWDAISKNNQVVRENGPRDAVMGRTGGKNVCRSWSGRGWPHLRTVMQARPVWPGQEWGWVVKAEDQDRADRAPQVTASMWTLLQIKQKTGQGFRQRNEGRYSVDVFKPSLWPQGVWAKVDQTWRAEGPFRRLFHESG